MIVTLSVILITLLFLRIVLHADMKAVITASMEPDIPVGSMIVIIPAAYEDIRVGDDITFVRDEKLTLVTHRVVEKDDEQRRVITQGLSNNVSDAPVCYENIIGKVSFTVPLLGYPIMYLETQTGKTAAVILVFLVIVVMLASEVLEKLKKKKGMTSDDSPSKTDTALSDINPENKE